ncbi:MAG: IclR family transcriptional regulator [Acidimicrobiia bacterium]
MHTESRHVLTVLRCFEEGPAELRLAEIARQTRLDRGDVEQALATLCQEGFLDRGGDGTYRLGRVVMVLGRRTEQATGLDGAEAVLQQLTARTGESSSLAVRCGTDALVLLLAPSPQRLRVEHGVGSHLPLHASAMGKALLAFADQEPEIAVTDLGRLDAFTNRTITSQSELIAELRVARAQGWAVNREERYEGVVGVAAPVIVLGRGVVAAIGVQGPAARLRPDEPALTRLVQRTAQHVAECLASGCPLPGYDERVEPASHS